MHCRAVAWGEPTLVVEVRDLFWREADVQIVLFKESSGEAVNLLPGEARCVVLVDIALKLLPLLEGANQLYGDAAAEGVELRPVFRVGTHWGSEVVEELAKDRRWDDDRLLVLNPAFRGDAAAVDAGDDSERVNRAAISVSPRVHWDVALKVARVVFVDRGPRPVAAVRVEEACSLASPAAVRV